MRPICDDRLGVWISTGCPDFRGMPSFHEHLAPSMQIWMAYQQAKCMWRKIRMLTPIQEVKGEEEGGKGGVPIVESFGKGDSSRLGSFFLSGQAFRSMHIHS